MIRLELRASLDVRARSKSGICRDLNKHTFPKGPLEL